MEILNCKINALKKNIKLIVIFTVCYGTGIIIGLFFGEKSVCYPLYDIACGRYICLLDVHTSVFSVFFNKIFSGSLILAWFERIYELFFVGNIFVSRADFREPFLYIPLELFCFGSDYLSFYCLHSEYYNNRGNDCCRYAELRHCGKAFFMQSERSDF